jgi:hypothetical protein
VPRALPVVPVRQQTKQAVQLCRMEDVPPTGDACSEDDGDGAPAVTLGPNLTVAAAVESNIRALFKSGAPSMQVGRTATPSPHSCWRFVRAGAASLSPCPPRAPADRQTPPCLTHAVRAALLQPMAMPEFTELLTSAGAKREYCTQFFRAFDRNHDGLIDYDEFLLAIIAMVRAAAVAGATLQLLRG